MKDKSFSRFFKELLPIEGYYPRKKPLHKRGRLVWNSNQQGTYVFALHGELK